MAHNGKRYDGEFKADAVRLVREGRPLKRVAQDLGVASQTLRNWIDESEKGKIPDQVRIIELEAELRAEKRKTKDLEETVDILKKATAFFAKYDRK